MDVEFALKLITAFAVLFLFMWNGVILRMGKRELNIIIMFECLVVGFCVSMLYALTLMYV